MFKFEAIAMRNRSALFIATLSLSLSLMAAGSSHAIPLGISKDAFAGLGGLVGASLRTDWLRNSPAGPHCDMPLITDRR
jgi:hypothetical protein